MTVLNQIWDGVQLLAACFAIGVCIGIVIRVAKAVVTWKFR